MRIDALYRVDLSAPTSSAANPPRTGATAAQIVTAIQTLNNSEFLGQDREMIYRRDRTTGQPVIQIVNRTSRDVIDQIPAEVLLKLQAEFEQEMRSKTPDPSDSQVG
jgi:uncharacterized FlaG/YvyC family protein